MPGFDAGTIVEALEYTFEPYVSAKGTVKEPSDKQIAEFMNGIKEVITKVQKDLPDNIDPTDVAQIMAAMDDFSPEIMVTLADDMAEVFSALCSGRPTKIQMLALPPRRRTLFYNWLQQEVLSPEAVPGGGTGAVTTLPRAVAG